MWSKLSLVFIALTICITGSSNDYRFAHLTSANGISQSEVYTFLEDRNGFMWIGTVDGLNRYDGYSFEIFNTDKSNVNSLTSNTVRCLAEDKYGRIWIGTDDGLCLYNQQQELMYKIKTKTYLDNTAIWSILVNDDYILLGTNDGLWKGSIIDTAYSEIEKNFKKISRYSNKTLRNSTIRRLLLNSSNEIWVQSDNLISKITFQPDKFEPTNIEDLIIEGDKGMVDIKVDAIGDIWILCSGNGIIKYNQQKKSSHNLTLSYDLLRNFSSKYKTLTIDKNQRIWVGSKDKGLVCINYDFIKNEIIKLDFIQHDPENAVGLNSNLINSSYVSSSNQLWVGTVGSGVNILDTEIKKIHHYKIKSQTNQISNTNFIRAVIADKQNRLLAGTQNNGLFLIDRATKQSKKIGFDTETVFYLSHYRDNFYLVCSGKGLSLIEIIGQSMRIGSSLEGLNLPALYVLKAKDDLYWCASTTGIYRIKIINDKIVFDGKWDKKTQPALSANNCRMLCFDDVNNQLIVGTEGGGLNLVKLNKQGDPVENKVYKMTESPKSLSNNCIRSIFIDKNEIFWIGTNEGLNKVEINKSNGEPSFKVYTRNSGLPNNMVEFIVDDNENNLWLGTNGGLSKFSPEKESFINYKIEDGLQSNEFSEHTVYKTESGELVMGGINGINAFYPEDFQNSKLTPRTLITDFYINNKRVKSGQEIGGNIPLEKSILYSNSIKLSPQSKNLGFKFSAMLYPNAGKIKYAYMLEGFDTEWQYTDALSRDIYYTNLLHGHYIFKVKASNTDGVWDEKPTTLSIHIKTPFYLTWFAMFLYVIIFISIFIYFSHYTVINLTTKRNLILEKEHNEKLHKLDELRARFFINISHDLRTPLTLISDPLNGILSDSSLSGKLKENLLLIKRNVKRLSFLIEQLLDIKKAESSKLSPKLQTDNFILFTHNEMAHFAYVLNMKGIEMKIETNEDPLWLSFDQAMLSKVYFNIISNAIKYTSAGYIKIKIDRVIKENVENIKESFIKVEISDTGIGIKKDQEKLIFERFYQNNSKNDQGYGIGLSHTKDIIDAHNGFIEAESIDNTGTTIRFFIPEVILPNSINPQVNTISDDLYINNNIEVESNIEVQENTKLKYVLVVEDNLEMLNYIKDSLKKYYNVIMATDGEVGLEIAKEKMPDIIISDLMMPKMDGIEFCKEIKTNINTSHIPVILLTAKADLKTRYEGIETGADDFISKPFEMEYLLIRIKNLLQSRENLRKLFQNSTTIDSSAITVTSIDEKFLSTIMEAIEEGMSDENFSINTLESQLGMSHSSFYRKIKTLTGQSAQELLMSIRIKKAHQILSENRGIRVSEVAYMVGFSSPQYFSKCFRDVYDFAPSEINNE